MRKRPMANAAIVEMTSATGTTASTINVLDAKSSGHVRHVKGFDKVAPLRVRGPFETTGYSP